MQHVGVGKSRFYLTPIFIGCRVFERLTCKRESERAIELESDFCTTDTRISENVITDDDDVTTVDCGGDGRRSLFQLLMPPRSSRRFYPINNFD